jgi:hypothetical protein
MRERLAEAEAKVPAGVDVDATLTGGATETLLSVAADAPGALLVVGSRGLRPTSAGAARLGLDGPRAVGDLPVDRYPPRDARNERDDVTPGDRGRAVSAAGRRSFTAVRETTYRVCGPVPMQPERGRASMP